MRRIAIVGAGQSGVQLGLGLLRHGYDVTLVTDRSVDEIRTGPVMSSQCMFETALQTERDLEINLWERECPPIENIALTLRQDDGEPAYSWAAKLDGYAQSVDQRLKVAEWVELFEERGGKLVLLAATPADVDELTRSHDLVVVSTGKGDLGRIFPRDPEKSPFDRPQRALALTYVTGMTPREGGSAVSFSIAPGIGEYFVFPALTVSGPCEIMVFEAVPGGPMDCWDDVETPADHLTRSKEILERFFPWEAARCQDVALTDDGGVLRGRLTPAVRRPVAQLPSGAYVLGMADAVVLNDPVTGQGSNNAAKAAAFYLDSIIGHGTAPFTPQWMQQTFDSFWRGWAQWVVWWTDSLLTAPATHVQSLLAAGAEIPGVATALANGFDDPRTFYPWWFDAAEAERFVAEKRAQELTRLDPRDLRRALGQYATGVTVVTCRGRDGQKVGMTANSFTSVSLDPPLVLWCPGKQAPSLPDFKSASHFTVNVLATNQHHFSRQFATPTEDKFAGVPLLEGIGGAPVIEGTVASFQCRTVGQYDAGDHVILLGEVEQYDAPGGEPLVFHSGYYHVATKHPDV